jgi:hypothetical protein
MYFQNTALYFTKNFQNLKNARHTREMEIMELNLEDNFPDTKQCRVRVN